MKSARTLLALDPTRNAGLRRGPVWGGGVGRRGGELVCGLFLSTPEEAEAGRHGEGGGQVMCGVGSPTQLACYVRRRPHERSRRRRGGELARAYPNGWSGLSPLLTHQTHHPGYWECKPGAGVESRPGGEEVLQRRLAKEFGS
jgi:hypothetical protein